jgi:MoaA/NifB/PqqE/SkfB family radical SAM enzyme
MIRGFEPEMPASAGFVVKELAAWPLSTPPRSAADPIRELHLEVTHRCDLRCRMCHHWRMKKRKKEISPAELARLLDSSVHLRGIRTAVLTGGEPILRPDLPEIAAVIAKRFPGVSLGILSNLSNTKLLFRRIDECLSRGITRLWLGSSLDGVGPAHDRVRGVRGAYARTMRSARELRDKYPDMDLAFNFTLLPFNADGLIEAYLAAKKMKIWFGAQKVVNHAGFTAEKYSWTPESLRAALSRIDWIIADICAENKAFEKLLAGKEHETPWLWSSLIYWIRLKDYLVRPRRFMSDCYAGGRYAMLSPGGELFFCPVRRHRIIGNALRDGFDAVWTCTRARTERKNIAGGRCHCWLHCIANPVLESAMTRRFAAKNKPQN